MMDFENIAFTRASGDIRYLTCADCESEVIGYQDMSGNHPDSLYVAVDLLLYDADEAQAIRNAIPRRLASDLLDNTSVSEI